MQLLADARLAAVQTARHVAEHLQLKPILLRRRAALTARTVVVLEAVLPPAGAQGAEEPTAYRDPGRQ